MVGEERRVRQQSGTHAAGSPDEVRLVDDEPVALLAVADVEARLGLAAAVEDLDHAGEV